MTECDFVESTERGEYCSYFHEVCDKEYCAIYKSGLGVKDLEIAFRELQMIKYQQR